MSMHLVQYKLEVLDKVSPVFKQLVSLEKKSSSGMANLTKKTNAVAKSISGIGAKSKSTSSSVNQMARKGSSGLTRMHRTATKVKQGIQSMKTKLQSVGPYVSRLQRGFVRFERRALLVQKRIGASMMKLKNKLGSVGTAITGYITLMGAKDLFFGLTGAASDQNEALNQSKVVFGSYYNDIAKFAKSGADSIGMSQEEIFSSTSLFAGLFKNIGVGEKGVAKMSEAAVRLAADLASFKNLSMEESLTALMGTLRGESQMAMKFGVPIDEMTLKQKAFDMGLVKTTKGTLPIAIRTQAIYASLIEKTKDAQGDFARTKMDDANRTRILIAEVKNLAASLGQYLLPIKLRVTNALIKGVRWIQANKEQVVSWTKKIVKVGVAILGVVAIAKSILIVSSLVKTVSLGFTILKNSVILAKVATIAFNVVARMNPFGWIVTAIGGVYYLVKNWDWAKGKLIAIAQVLWKLNPLSWLLEFTNKIIPGFESNFNKFLGMLKDGLLKAANWVYDKVIKPLFGWLSDITGIDLIFKPSVEKPNIPKGGKRNYGGHGTEFSAPYDYNAALNFGDNPNMPNTSKNPIKDTIDGLVTGAGKEIKNITINIENLVREFMIKTENMGMTPAQVKSEMTRALMTAVNEANYQ